jgi:hypothetical protein
MRDLIHPRKRAARANFFPHTITFLRMGKRDATETPRDGYADMPCAYRPALLNQEPGMMESEAGSNDQVLLNGFYPDIKPKSIGMLTVGGAEKRVHVLDNLTTGIDAETTLLLVSPDA